MNCRFHHFASTFGADRDQFDWRLWNIRCHHVAISRVRPVGLHYTSHLLVLHGCGADIPLAIDHPVLAV